MSQLTTLLWLKWTLFRNSLRSTKAVVNRIATILAMLAALAFALLIALGLGAVSYALSSPELSLQASGEGGRELPSAEFIFFSIFAMCYLLWATLPLSIGVNRQFDPGHLLLYPISLRRLFALDFVSEIASLQSIFAIPAILAIGLGAGLAKNQVAWALLGAALAAVFGIALSKWVSTSIGSLLRKKQTRGESLLALIGAVAGLGGVVFAQVAPTVFRHTESFGGLRWTPPGAIAFALTGGLGEGAMRNYALAITILSVYTAIVIGVTYRLAHRSAMGGGKSKKKASTVASKETTRRYTGWNVPFTSPALAAVIEKELRYATRNAQLRMMAAMPLILIAVRLMNQRRFDSENPGGTSSLVADFLTYGEGLMATGGVLYVFLILTGLSCNQFAFEHAGMRTLVLSPIDRRDILLGKNIAMVVVALILSAALLLVNELVFRDLTPRALLFAGLSFIVFAGLTSILGNWFSIKFPKRMKFGTRLNVSGVVGLLLIPMIMLLALPPFAAAAAGYIAESIAVGYATLAVLAVFSIVFYLVVIRSQGDLLQRRELEILETVNDPGND